MKKIFFYLLALSHVFGQSVIDTLSVTIYPEFSYPGVAIEYKFDKIGNDELIFPIPSSIDSVLYTISGNDVEFEQILETKNNSLTALNKDGNHTIYLFLDKFISDPGPRKFSYSFQSKQLINTFILGVQIPFASEDFSVNAEGFSLERVRDHNGLTFLQGIIGGFSSTSSTNIDLSYYNPHGNTSIQYAANISTQDSAVQPPPTASERFVRYPFLTWEPMLIFILLSIILVLFYEFKRNKNA